MMVRKVNDKRVSAVHESNRLLVSPAGASVDAECRMLVYEVRHACDDLVGYLAKLAEGNPEKFRLLCSSGVFTIGFDECHVEGRIRVALSIPAEA